jgi:hypothetical protein
MAPGYELSAVKVAIEPHVDIESLPKTLESFTAAPSTGPIVLDPAQITSDFDPLRFEAAALEQLYVIRQVNTQKEKDSKPTETQHLSFLLISSPYNNPGHYLDLKSLDKANLIFSKALTALKPARVDYATAFYADALNFPTVLELVRNLSKIEHFEWKETSFYVVVFRSKLKEQIDTELLYKLDYESHREACESGGLLKYWFGKPNEEKRNLATCKFARSFPLSPFFHPIPRSLQKSASPHSFIASRL